ncbi:hypothetical protein P153DRAFT_278928, partial [Dothidotthia symphoricarpi CBS 119687]
SLLVSGEYSDLIITCGNNSYNVHKAIVCSLSSFFRTAEKFAVGKVSLQHGQHQEAAEAKIDLPEDDPAVIELLMQYFYKFEYEPELPDNKRSLPGVVYVAVKTESGYSYDFPHTCQPGCPGDDYKVCPHHVCTSDTCGEKCRNFMCQDCTSAPPQGDASQLLVHAKMYEIADKYGVAGLKELAREKFARGCRVYWEDEEFPPAAEHALVTTVDKDAGLREVLILTITSHIKLLQKPAIEELLIKHASFAYVVLKRQAEELDRLRSRT